MTDKFDAAKSKRKASLENRDFIPHKIAKRLKETIVFSLKLDSQSKDVNNG